ncbi:MAG: DUF937 domain-containing protein [Cyanothece sp. SIO1E1]|nr:DUF937 domain-containing protein [Cyanothece sp. SIO1E1]
MIEMGLFFEVLSAINNPNQQANIAQLSSINSTVQQLAASQNLEATTLQSILSHLGCLLRAMLQRQQAKLAEQSLAQLISEVTADSTESASVGKLPTLLTPQAKQQVLRTLIEETGISGNTLKTMLPTLMPAALGLLQMGSSSPGKQAPNSILSTFIESDSDADVDIGDAFKFADRFLNPSG